jgi:hypothetical protein
MPVQFVVTQQIRYEGSNCFIFYAPLEHRDKCIEAFDKIFAERLAGRYHFTTYSQDDPEFIVNSGEFSERCEKLLSEVFGWVDAKTIIEPDIYNCEPCDCEDCPVHHAGGVETETETETEKVDETEKVAPIKYYKSVETSVLQPQRYNNPKLDVHIVGSYHFNVDI